jgi:hypothetical protein
LLLSSTVKKENDLLTVDLATPDLKDQTGQLVLPRGTLHRVPHQVPLARLLLRAACASRTTRTPAVDVELALSFNADYEDIFEVRGSKRERRACATIRSSTAPASSSATRDWIGSCGGRGSRSIRRPKS